MKRNLLFLVAGLALVGNVAQGAITIKKAAPVAAKQTSALEAGQTLVPTVLGLVSGIQQLNKQQKELTAECSPTGQELDFVNKIVKEWAKTGAATADEVENRLGMRRCSTGPTGGYQTSVRVAAGTDESSIVCFDYFGGQVMKVWFGNTSQWLLRLIIAQMGR